MSTDKLSAMRKSAGSALMKSIKSNYRTGDGRANLTNVTKALKEKGMSGDQIKSTIKVLQKKGVESAYKSFKIKKAVETLKKAGVLKTDQSAAGVATHVIHSMEKAVDSLEKTSTKPPVSFARNYAKERRDEELDEKRKHGLIEKEESREEKKGIQPLELSHTSTSEHHTQLPKNSPTPFNRPSPLQHPYMPSAQQPPPHVLPPTINPPTAPPHAA
ncbi:hypothetical protein HY620_02555 [Candidatus Uhrbacteria bacterium]|nr:hypothetical protein [Candidatus Uhrbacteria bacterium]